ncbi:4'-phosphopantetheinyl transferase family protein [Actinoplanes derwentensis]|uniref:4'-phosphopantetheinyl transferase EntD (Siderophore biosynthesis) n=1 Tax=Actinoplanes derwentensis TaxID=113562 RepID=A0A1H1Y7Z8_9ACTN|nr:4'-phosphopantetheinyl transferase superfamily protein [Actinoplanes derwentensis]GID86688.1 putative 4'-phosphopantetheinyl transferase [Actinoplanes derwentensis]SDT17511.1 4'-phosphopantetheinyl transferase EntD (siderophore biosynthesis) [Actinoplanes derwentensis]
MNAGILAGLLPATVVTAETYTDPPGLVLFPAEEAVIARAVGKRRREFTTVRHCARTALARLGTAAVPILPGDRGAPGWPAGVVGSMTHCDGFRGSAVAWAADVLTIGLDAEPAAPLPDGVLNAIALPEEKLPVENSGVPWDRLLFSAKESVYKAWFPLTRRFIGFEAARIELDPGGTFAATMLDRRAGDPAGFTGRWICANGLVVTAIAVPA